MTDKEAREAAHEAFGGLISTDWAGASDWEREEVRRSVDAAIDAYLATTREGMPSLDHDGALARAKAAQTFNRMSVMAWPDRAHAALRQLGEELEVALSHIHRPAHSALIAEARQYVNKWEACGYSEPVDPAVEMIRRLATALEGKTDD